MGTQTLPTAEQAGQSTFQTTYSQLGFANPLLSIASPLQLTAGLSAAPSASSHAQGQEQPEALRLQGHKATRALRSHPWIMFSMQKHRDGCGQQPRGSSHLPRPKHQEIAGCSCCSQNFPPNTPRYTKYFSCIRLFLYI